MTLTPPADEEAALGRLLSVVRWFDETVSVAEPASPAVQALTRSIAAAGRVLVQHEHLPDGHPVRQTITRADEYAAEPGPDTYASYADAATRAYPFGAGDGCHRVPELAYNCDPGSGCRSGAGSLYQVALAVGARAVLAAIEREVGPWSRALGTPFPLP